MFLRKCPSLHAPGDAPPSLFVPRTLNISSSVSTTLQNNHSSSYTSMSLHIDLIEHIAGKVLRNPLGALFPSSQQSLIAVLKTSNPFIASSLSVFLSFVLALNYLFPRSHFCLHLPPSLHSALIPPLPLFTPPPLPLQSVILCSSLSCMHLLTPHLMLWICGAKKPTAEISQSVSLSSSQSNIFQPADAKAF